LARNRYGRPRTEGAETIGRPWGNVGSVIDIQSIRGGNEADWETQRAEVEAVWREAGLVVVDRSAHLPDVVEGVPSAAIWGRRGGGAGGGLAQQALQIFLNLWPLAAAGYVGAVSADAWTLTKKGTSVALKRLLGSTADKVGVWVADDGSGLRDDTFEFKASDLADIDHALDAMVDTVVARSRLEGRSWMHYVWDSARGDWVPDPRFLREDEH
jgi:hypothetical protein